MSAILSLTQLEAGPEVVHKQLKPKTEMKLPLLSARIGAEICLKPETHRRTGEFKIRVGLSYFEPVTKGHAKAPEIICAPLGKKIRSLPFVSACQKVPSTIPVPCFSKPEKDLAVAVLLSDGRRRARQKVLIVCSGANEDVIFF